MNQKKKKKKKQKCFSLLSSPTLALLGHPCPGREGEVSKEGSGEQQKQFFDSCAHSCNAFKTK